MGCMGTTDLYEVQNELEAILRAESDRSSWTIDTRGRYFELSRREDALLRGRLVAA